MNYFSELNSVDCSAHVEKKGQFNYLSWTFAVQELKKRHPDATWEVKRFYNGECEVPYMKTECGYFVEVALRISGIEQSHIHPILDNRNRPVDQPDAFQVNTSIMRCLVKCIAISTGLGLYIFSGEDLPELSQDDIEAKIENCESVQALSGLYVSLVDSDKNKYKDLFTEKRQKLEG